MEIRTIDQLKQWNRNPRTIDKEGAQRLREQLLMGQHSTLLVMLDGTIIGGNMRFPAMKVLILENKMKNAIKCFVLDFKQDAQGWFAVLEGEEIRTKYYKTKEDGMMEYSLSHNDRAGSYQDDLMKKVMTEFSIDWSKYAIDLGAPVTIDKLMKPVKVENTNTEVDINNLTSDLNIECPKCGFHFQVVDKKKLDGQQSTP